MWCARGNAHDAHDAERHARGEVDEGLRWVRLVCVLFVLVCCEGFSLCVGYWFVVCCLFCVVVVVVMCAFVLSMGYVGMWLYLFLVGVAVPR